MTDLQMWSLIVGFASPLIISVVEQPRWTASVRALITALVCIIFGALTAYFEGALTAERWVEAALVVGVAAITFYKGLWKPTGVAPAIEAATSPSTAPAA
jgi:hypothetical protein